MTKHLTPMMQQYREIKDKHKDQILFFRLGDFYEMFFDDAILASRELNLTLTGRDCGLPERAPMCGVPYHSCDSYIARLVEKGHKVAICEQVEDPKEAQGLVKREIVRIVTPGTVLDKQALHEDCNNFIAVVYGEAGKCGLAFADISTGEVKACKLPDSLQRVEDELGRFSPSEIIIGGTMEQSEPLRNYVLNKLNCSISDFNFSIIDAEMCADMLPTQFGAQNLGLLGLEGETQMQKALCAMLCYLTETQKRGVECVRALDLYDADDYMALNMAASRNLELTRTLRTGEKRGSLLWVLDKTETAMGKRLLRSWVEKPLVSPSRITKRLNAVAELTENTMLLGDLADTMQNINDMERLMSRIAFGSATPKDLKALQSAMEKLPQLRRLLEPCASTYMKDIYRGMDPLDDLTKFIDDAIAPEPPMSLKEGEVIKPGFDEQLDELRDLVQGAKKYIAKLEAEEREKTGIRNLRVGYNRVFGYYIEVTKSYIPMVPDTYIRKQTLANCERYITPELKDLENRIVDATEKIEKVELALYKKVREGICNCMARVQTAASYVARLDAFCSFAQVSIQNGYTRPQVDLSGAIEIEEGRHPVVEQMLGSLPFVSNDVHLDMDKNRIAIITGPNMSGKSTYMRMAALISIMAQAGCFVPAKSARLSIVDGVYTRVGATDDLGTGQSTFMVEMNEVADILRSATRNSLIILDEIGRGTSTYDGMSIAQAVVEYIADKRLLGAKAMFATHYHELTELEQALPCVKNYNVAVKKQGENVIFLRRIVRGGADESYGIYVSKLAGIPTDVVKRAQAILSKLEAGNAPAKAPPRDDGQIRITQVDESEIVKRLRETDPNSLTPLAALTLLNELKGLL